MAADFKHVTFENMALPYITNLSPIDATPRLTAGLNVLTSSRGYVERRPGWKNFGATTQRANPTTDVIRRFFKWEKWDGTIFLFASLCTLNPAGTSKVLKLKVGTDTDWVGLTTADDSTTNEPYDYAVSNNHIFFSNGSKKWKYDGTTVTLWGIVAPTTDLTLTPSGGAGALTGTYQYVIAWLNNNTGHTSSPSPVGTITVTAKDVTITGGTTSDTQVTHVRIFRTLAGGSIFYEIDDSPTTYAAYTGSGYTDNNTDAELDVTSVAPAPHHNDPPPAFKDPEWYQGRIWGFKDDKVYHSGWEEIPLGTSDMPEECYPPDNYFPFGKRLTGLCATGDPSDDGVLCVFSAGVLFHISGDSLDTFTRGTIANGVGCRNRGAIAKYRKITAWFDSANMVNVTDGVRVYEIGRAIRADIATSTIHDNVFMFVHSAGEDQWLFVGNIANSNNCLVYDLDREEWMPPWVFTAVANAAAWTGESLETAAGVFKPIIAVNGYTAELTRTESDDDEADFAMNLTTNLFPIAARPNKVGAVDHISLEYGTTAPATVVLTTDETASTLSSISGNPVDPPLRTNGSAVIEKIWGTESGPFGRRAKVAITWAAADSVARLYSLDMAYKERG